MNTKQFLGIGALSGALVLAFVCPQLKIDTIEKYTLPLIFASCGAVLGLAIGGIAAGTAQGARNQKPGARFFHWGAIGTLAGALLGVPMAMTMEAGSTDGTLVAQAAMIVIFSIMGSIVLASYGILSRKASPDEQFLPSTKKQHGKPISPLIMQIVVGGLASIGILQRLWMLYSSNSLQFDAALIAGIGVTLLILYMTVRLTNDRYKKRLLEYEAEASSESTKDHGRPER